MVDGVSGNNCDYSIQTVSGVSVVNVTSSLGTHLCPGSTTTLTANAQGATSYSWSSIPAGASGTGSTLDVSPTVNTTYTCTITGPCGGEISSSIDIVVEAPYATISGDTSICVTESSTVNFTGYPNSIITYSTGNGINHTIQLSNNGTANISNASLTSSTTFYLINAYYNNQPSCITVLTDSVVIDIHQMPNLSILPDTICLGDTAQLIAVPSIQGGIFTWSNSTNTNDTLTIVTVSSVNYAVTYTNYCIVTDTGKIVVLPIPQQTLSYNSPLCEADTLSLSSQFQTGYTYLWNGPNGFTSTAQNPSINNIPVNNSGNYILQTVLNGCSSLDTINVIVNPIPIVNFTSDIISGCSPLTVTFYDQSIPLNSTNQWNFGDGSIGSDSDTITHTFLDSGYFTITLISSNNGCISSTTKQNMVHVFPKVHASFVEHLIDEHKYNFLNTTTDATHYTWMISDGTSYTSADLTHTLIPNDTSYVIELIAINDYGCIDTAFTSIQVDEELVFYVPNSFTPDGDDYNNTFQPVFTSGYEPSSYKLFIYDRWGELLFHTTNSKMGWDGTYRGNKVQDDSYVWKIEFRKKHTDESFVEVGHVNLVK